MIDHISLPVSDVTRSGSFYSHLLEPLGLAQVMGIDHDGHSARGFGEADTGKPFFWIGGPASGVARPVAVPEGQHVAFTAATRAQVDAFHAAGLAAGGRDNGVPGLRPDYHENYYAGFIIDPDGHHLEAVCHRPA